MVKQLPRTVKTYNVGADVEAHGRAMHRYLDDGQLAAFTKQPKTIRRTFGIGKRTLAKKSAAKAGLPQYGVVGPDLYAAMRDAHAYDAYADALLEEYVKASAPKPPALVYPHDKLFDSYCGGYLHQTGGIAGNWALDFMAAPGTPVLAPEAGTVSRTSGYDPASGLHGSNRDVFGWSVYLRCSTGFFYATHFGRLTVHGGSRVKAGQVVGYVGDWPHDRGRSHTHLGFTSFSRVGAVSRRKIQAVAAAPRVVGVRV